MAVPSYRERLRTEGLTLAACGAAGSLVLWRFFPQARRWPLNTLGQLAVTAGLYARFGTRTVRKSLDEAVEAEPGGEGTGEPTPLWELPVIMVGLAAAFPLLPSDRAGWDASL